MKKILEKLLGKTKKAGEDVKAVIEDCGAPFELQRVAMSLLEEWEVDNCEVAIITAKSDEIILEATDEHENKLQVKVHIKNGEARMSVILG